MTTGWFQHLEQDSELLDRLVGAGMNDSSKWLDRLSKMTLVKFQLLFGAKLLPADFVMVEEAVGAALGRDDWAFAFEEDANAPARNNNHQSLEPAALLPGTRLLHLGPRPPQFEFSTIGAVKFSKEFSCLLGAIAGARCNARPSWYCKLLRA